MSSQQISLIAAVDETEKLSNALMTIWDAADPGQQPEYSEHRMGHMLHLISNALTEFTTQKLTSVTACHGVSTTQDTGGLTQSSVWGLQSPTDVARAEAAVSDAVTVLQTWRNRFVKQLMLDWMPGPCSISSHPWRGSAFEHKHLDAHIARFERVRDLLGLKRELVKTLGREEQQLVQDAFAALGVVEPFQAWSSAPDCLVLICNCCDCGHRACMPQLSSQIDMPAGG